MTDFGVSANKTLEKLAKFELLQTGDTGHGKTTRALTATRFGPVYVFDFDGKLQGALRDLSSEEKILIRSDNYKFQTFDHAYKKLQELEALYAAGETPFATVVIDTFTMLNEKAYIKAMGKKLHKDGAKASYDEWGVIGNCLLNFFNILSNLPCNVIINAHIAKVEDAAGRQVLGVEGQGSFKNKIAKRVTDSHYLYFDMGKWFVRVLKSNSLPANSNIDKRYIDSKGNAMVWDLSVFDDYAYKL